MPHRSCHESIVTLSPGACIRCPWGSRVAHGRAAIQPVTSEPIISNVHPYHKIAVMFALLERSHPPSLTLCSPLPLCYLIVQHKCSLSASVLLDRVFSVKQVTLTNNLNMSHLWRELYKRLSWLTIWLFMYSWLPL